MKDIYFFPFTHIDPDQARTMDAFFTEFKVLNLNPGNLAEPHCRQLVKNGRLKVLSVGEEKMALVDAKVAAFREWAAVHKGNERNLKALIREKTWLQDDTGVAALQSRIRRGAVPETDGAAGMENDPLLFLRFAEILDGETQSIRRGLKALEADNAALFAELKGEINDIKECATPETRPEGQVDRPRGIKDRIRAWCTTAAGLVSEAAAFDSGAYLATTNNGVVDYLETNSYRVINELDIDSIKVHEHGCHFREQWQQMFDRALEKMRCGKKFCLPARSDDTGCSCPDGRIRILHFPDGDLNKEFNIPGRQVFVCLLELNS